MDTTTIFANATTLCWIGVTTGALVIDWAGFNGQLIIARILRILD